MVKCACCIMQFLALYHDTFQGHLCFFINYNKLERRTILIFFSYLLIGLKTTCGVEATICQKYLQVSINYMKTSISFLVILIKACKTLNTCVYSQRNMENKTDQFMLCCFCVFGGWQISFQLPNTINLWAGWSDTS